MAEEVPSRPFLVMGDILYDIKLVDLPSCWAKVKCLKKEAYGCGEHGDLIVEGLDLYVRGGPDDDQDFHPCMCIGASLRVRSCIGGQIDQDMAEIYGRHIRISGGVYTVAGHVMVLRISFIARHDSSYFRSYYLVYDSAAAALSLLPHDVPGYQITCTPFPVKHPGGKYSLVLTAEKFTAEGPLHRVFLTWSQPPVLPARLSKFNSYKHGWVERSSLFQHVDEFVPSVVFSHKRITLWCDLGLGFMYYDSSHFVLGDRPVGEFKYLPSGCGARYSFDQPPMDMYRNMGSVGNCIWFVIIEPPKEEEDCPGETMVKVWAMDRLSQEGRWKLHSEFKMQTIWELDGFRKHGLPRTVPKFPILREQDHGILYMLLPEPYNGGPSYARLVGIDLSSSRAGMRLVVHRRLVIPWMDRPVVLDSDFFRPGSNVTV
jgi:hypothetical protein